MTGKEKCEMLKAIRKKIAEVNSIEYSTEPCNNEGDCPGFCPQCDLEAANLLDNLKKKEAEGLQIQVDTDILENFETLVGTPTDEELSLPELLGEINIII